MRCEQCANLILWLEARLRKRKRKFRYHKKYYGSHTAMKGTARDGCELCAAVVTEIDDQLQLKSLDQKITYLEISARLYERTDGRDSPSYLHVVFEVQTKNQEENPLEIYQFLPRPLAEVSEGRLEEKYSPENGRNIPYSCRSPACFQMIAQWVKRCRASHQQCRPASDAPGSMPNRLVDLGDGLTQPRILVTNGVVGEYTTLSYCWGDSNTYKQPITTSQNLDRREQVLHLTTLPPVFQDAFAVTRTLGYRYIWIDSLCILQDSATDWREESSKMQKYYMNSTLNIIAAAAENPTCGMFDAANFERWSARYTSGDDDHYESGYLESYVDRRAWTVQEEVLPPRSIIYTTRNLYWRCNYESTTEECISEVARATEHRDCVCSLHKKSKKKLFSFTPRQSQKGPPGEEYYRWWYDILDYYVAKDITKKTDRLPAIAGLAKEFANRTQTNYLCGLWEEDLMRGLCWQGNGARTNDRDPNADYIGPTWSWVDLDIERMGRYTVFYRDVHGFEVGGDNATKLVYKYVKNKGPDQYGQISEAVLVLEGYCRKMLDTAVEPLYIERPLDTPARNKDDTKKRIFCHMDSHKCQSGYCVGCPKCVNPEAVYLKLGKPSRNEAEAMYLDTWALILEPTGRENDRFGSEVYKEYRRIGIAEMPCNNELIGGWMKQRIAVI